MNRRPPNMQQRPPNINQRPPNMPQGLQNTHQWSPFMHQRPPNMYQTPQNIYQTPPNIHQTPPNIYQTPQNIHHTPQDIHHTPPYMHQTPSNIHHTPQIMHQAPPNMYQTSPNNWNAHRHPGNSAAFGQQNKNNFTQRLPSMPNMHRPISNSCPYRPPMHGNMAKQYNNSDINTMSNNTIKHETPNHKKEVSQKETTQQKPQKKNKKEKRNNRILKQDTRKEDHIMKHCQSLPYDFDWPAMNKQDIKAVICELKSVLSANFCNQFLMKKRKKVTSSRPNATIEEINHILKEIALKHEHSKNLNIEEAIKSLDDKELVSCFSTYFVLGINAVTKHMENLGCLDLLIVCSSANPSIMTQHLLCQSLINNIPACNVNNLSKTVAPIFDVGSVLAIGFKTVKNNPFCDLIEFIKNKIPNENELPENHITHVLKMFQEKTLPNENNTEIEAESITQEEDVKQDSLTGRSNILDTTSKESDSIVEPDSPDNSENAPESMDPENTVKQNQKKKKRKGASYQKPNISLKAVKKRKKDRR